jgi:hypothetical protein
MKKILSVFLFLTILYSCQKSNDDQASIPPDGNNAPNFVSLEEAVKIAEMQAPPVKGSAKAQLSIQRVKSTFSVKPDNDNPSMYIVNYENNGFAIISADNRMYPVLAYSDNNSFPTESKILPGGLVDWLSNTDSIVKKIRKENPKQDSVRKKQWDKFKIKNVLAIQNSKSAEGVMDVNECSYPGQLQTYYSTRGPFTDTEWSQGDGFNESLPNKGCQNAEYRTNGKPYTGCLATAMAQIMMYWKFPSNYYWTSMWPTGSTEASRLMKDLGLSANLNMDYSSCNYSKASLSRASATFVRFGYPAPSYSDYNYFTVKSELYNNRPVILYGTNKTGGWWIFSTYADGHAWVCDGFQENTYYECAFDPNTPGEWIENYTGYDALLYMNWGLKGDYNAWYGAYDFTPANSNYNYRTKMITNIRRP